MKIIQRPWFFLLWSTKLALSAAQDGPFPTSVSQYPLCIQQDECLQLAVLTYCSLTPTIGCVCKDQAIGIFIVLYYCALYSCSRGDMSITLGLVNDECIKNGYNWASTINQALEQPTYTFSIASESPTNPTTIFQSSNPSVTGTSNPTTNTNTSTQSNSSGGLSTAAIIGIVVGGVAVIAIIAGLIVFCMKHKAKQQRLQAMSTAPPPPPPAVPQPLPQIQYMGSPPPGNPPYSAPVYPPHQQPIMQQQQQPLIQGYQELEQPVTGFYAAKDAEVVLSTVPATTTATPDPLPPGQQGQYLQELPGHQGPPQEGPGIAQEGHVFVEMPSDNRRR
ncbi:hypothetical protein L211DRAFT_489961 [Terfezia boudieri ATCC MYA-4762]|uniref:Extracellular membrane protein CFEM domain-containing protein n=1 Tax=Terfezia boudieri ATCC MYA-4762 TaxID=1051890 RepID=A0A3N4LDG8_9PEZI|nr:hypothetical protein L211DRAFT_489961 [Terfezia boudieri ATCC MYA-4762]